MRKIIVGVLVCVAVVLIGGVPLFEAAKTKTDDLLYTTDVSGPGGVPAFAVVKPGRSLCVPGVEIRRGAASARIYARSLTSDDIRTRLRITGDPGEPEATKAVQLPGEVHELIVPLGVERNLLDSRACVVNAGRRSIDLGVGQSGSVGYAAPPPKPLLRIDILGGPPEARVARLGHALRVATLFKSPIVGRGLLIGLAIATVLAVLALMVVVVRQTSDEDEA